MVRYFITRPGEKGLTEIETPEKNCWIHMEPPAAEEVVGVTGLTKMPEGFIKSALAYDKKALELFGEKQGSIFEILLSGRIIKDI
jgi:hypothetical protein